MPRTLYSVLKVRITNTVHFYDFDCLVLKKSCYWTKQLFTTNLLTEMLQPGLQLVTNKYSSYNILINFSAQIIKIEVVRVFLAKQEWFVVYNIGYCIYRRSFTIYCLIHILSTLLSATVLAEKSLFHRASTFSHFS